MSLFRPMRSAHSFGSGGAASRRRFLLFFLCTFLLAGSWAVATPPWAAPDEPAHVFRAAAVVRGDFLPTEKSPTDSQYVLHVPAGLVTSAAGISCFTFHADVPASCAPGSGPDSRLVGVATAAARYHPVYYALVGWPTLVFSSSKTVFLMRLLSAFIVSLLIALGLQSAAEHPRSRLLLTGSFLALTPMVVFLNGTVQPSTLEIAGGFTVWASGLTLIATDDPVHRATLIRRLGVAAALMTVSRSISPLWLFLSLLALGLLAGRRQIVELARLRSTWIWGSVVAVSTFASLAWTVFANPNPLPVPRAEQVSLPSAVRRVMEVMPVRLDQYIGRFGWLDTPSPTYSIVVLTVLIGFMVVLGLAVGTRREALVLGAVLVAVVFLPVAMEAKVFNTAGYFWQMRYTMPLAVGIPMIGAVAVTRESAGSLRTLLESRLPWLVVAFAVPAHLLCFVWALRRYEFGANAPLGVLEGSWAPRLGTWTVIALQLAGLVFWAVLTVRCSRGRTDDELRDTRPQYRLMAA